MPNDSLKSARKKKNIKKRERERPHPHSQQRRSRGGTLGKANWSTTASYMLGGGGSGGLCNPIPALAPVLSSPSPRHSHPISSPLPLLSPCQTPIKHPAQTAGALRWPIGPWLCRELSSAWGHQRAVNCAPFLRRPQLDCSSRVTPVKHSLDC